MAILKKSLFDESLETINVLVNDTDPNSEYFKITELPDTFTGGKNAFLIQGSPELVADTIVKIQIRDSQGRIIYHEPGEGIPEYFEGTSKVVAVYIYPDTAFGPCTITILGELSEYVSNGVRVPVPENWKDTYNIKWEKQINVNPILANTSKIRFYRRPKIDITESVLPIFNRSVNRLTVSGSVNGTPIIPSAGEDYRTFKGVLQYELSLNGLSQFSESMEREIIEISGPGFQKIYLPTITDVTTNKKAFVNTPHYITGSSLPNYYSVTAFTSASYTMSYDAEVTLTDSAINSSFATINITDLETFSGDVNRIKVYASSKNDLGDFQLLEDVQLESNELLLTSSFANQLNVRTGLFTNAILSSFWTSSAIESDVNLSVDNTTLLKSVLLTPQSDYSSSVGLFKFYNKESINFTKNTEYQLDFTPLLSEAADTFGGIEVYMSGSAFTATSLQTNYGKKIGELTTNTQFRKYDKQQINFKPDADGVGNLVYVVKGGVWHISDISLRAAQESSFSPNEITLTVNVPVKINNETFDFKFELYDINNNFVPVLLEKEFTFTGGNDVSVRRDLQLNVSNNSFNFSTASAFPQFITIDFTKTGLTGSVTFESQSVDVLGNLITGTPKPGTLEEVDVDTRKLFLAEFTGSSALGVTVGAISYTASCEDINRYFTIFRIEQGAPAKLFFATADKNNFVFDPDDRYKSDIADDFIDIRLVRQNLPASVDEGFNITSGSEVGVPPKLIEVETIGNATVYRLHVTSSTYQSGSGGYVYDIGQSHYDFTYDSVDGEFTSSVTIDAVSKGDKGKGLIATSDRNQFFYKMTDLSPTPSSQTATILVKRLNLGSLSNTITFAKTGSGPDLTTVSQNVGNGVAQFSVNTSAYQFEMGETKYVFQATDLNGVVYNDEISLATVIAESQISVNLTNENVTLPARSTGFVESGSFVLTSGSVSVKVGGEDIVRQEGLSLTNRFDVISVTGSNCTPNGGQGSNPSNATYSITDLTADSGSLSILVRYKDGRGSTTDITKIVTYSKAKAAAPVLTFVIENNNQSTDAKSTGEQITSFSNSTLSVKEQYNGSTSTLTLSSAPTINSSSAFLGITKTTTNLSYPTLATATDSVELSITGSVNDSEVISRQVFGNVSLTKVKKAAPLLLISTTNKAQSVSAKSTGTQIDTFVNSTVTVSQTYNGSTTNLPLTLLSGSSSDLASIVTNNSTGLITLAGRNLESGTNAASVAVTASVLDSEGQSRTLTDTISLTKVKKAAPSVLLTANPQNQTIPATSQSEQIGNLSNVTLDALEGTSSVFNSASILSSNFTGASITGTSKTFVIGSIANGVPAASSSIGINYTDSEGTKGNSVISVFAVKSLAGNTGASGAPGATGPGITYVGECSGLNNSFVWTNDSIARNVTSTTGTYYITKPAAHGLAKSVTGCPPNATYFEAMQDFDSVATDIFLAQDATITNGLVMGTFGGNNGFIRSANASSLNSGHGYYLDRDGNVRFGTDTTGSNWLRFENGTLTVNGSINVTGGNAATQTYANTIGTNAVTSGSNAATAAQQAATIAGQTAATNAAASASAAQIFAQTAANNAVTSGSNAASTAQQNAINTANTNALAFASASVNLLANGGWVGGSGTFITSTSISSPIIASNAGFISGIFKVGQNGITLDGTSKSIYVGSGSYNDSNTPFYFKSGSTDVFSLGNKLSFNGSNLTVSGSINATAGNFSGNITSTATISGGTISGGTISGGSVNIGSGKFFVGTDGTMTCTGANINGTVTADQGSIGGWSINPDGLSFTNATSTRGVKLNSVRGALEVSTSGSVTVDINSNEFLTDLTAGTNVSSGYSLFVPSGVVQGNGTPKYGSTGGTPFNLVAGQTYQFSHSTGFMYDVTVSSDIYNSLQYGIIISTNPTPTIDNAEFIIADSKYRFTPGSLQPSQITGNFTATSSGPYYIRPYILLTSYQLVDDNYVAVTGTLTGDLYFYSVSIDRSTQKTEIVGGGIQVVKDIDTFFKVDRNAVGSIVTPFVNVQGSSILFKGDVSTNANNFHAENFRDIQLQTGGTEIYLGTSSDYLGIYNVLGCRLSGGFIRLEPTGGEYAYVGNANVPAARILVGAGGPSDERLKTEIEEVSGSSLEKIKELNIKSFRFKENNREGDGSGNKKIGVIAQDVLKTSLSHLVAQNYPELDGDYNVDHFSLLGYAVKAIQELSAKVEKLEAKLSGSI